MEGKIQQAVSYLSRHLRATMKDLMANCDFEDRTDAALVMHRVVQQGTAYKQGDEYVYVDLSDVQVKKAEPRVITRAAPAQVEKSKVEPKPAPVAFTERGENDPPIPIIKAGLERNTLHGHVALYICLQRNRQHRVTYDELRSAFDITYGVALSVMDDLVKAGWIEKFLGRPIRFSYLTAKGWPFSDYQKEDLQTDWKSKPWRITGRKGILRQQLDAEVAKSRRTVKPKVADEDVIRAGGKALQERLAQPSVNTPQAVAFRELANKASANWPNVPANASAEEVPNTVKSLMTAGIATQAMPSVNPSADEFHKREVGILLGLSNLFADYAALVEERRQFLESQDV